MSNKKTMWPSYVYFDYFNNTEVRVSLSYHFLDVRAVILLKKRKRCIKENTEEINDKGKSRIYCIPTYYSVS